MKRLGCIEDRLYCIDTEAFNSGVPYADSFTVRTHVCLYKDEDNTTKLSVKAEIVFRKDLWNFLKTKIGTYLFRIMYILYCMPPENET